MAYSSTCEIDPAGRPLGRRRACATKASVAPMCRLLRGQRLQCPPQASGDRDGGTVRSRDPAGRGLGVFAARRRRAGRSWSCPATRSSTGSRHTRCPRASRDAEQSLQVVERAFASAPAHLQGLKPGPWRASIAISPPSRSRRRRARRGRARATEVGRRVRLDPRLLLIRIRLRLCVRWALARCVSPRAAERIATLWRRGRHT